MTDLNSMSDEQLAQIAGITLPPPASGSDTTMSVRNNNPGNMRKGSGFASFDSPKAGLAAMQNDLEHKISGASPVMKSRYGDNYQPTIRNVVSTWAPPSENNTDNYINFVSQHSGISPDQPLTVADTQKIMQPMIHMEGGKKASDYFGKIMGSIGDAVIPPAEAQQPAQPTPDLNSMSDEQLAQIAGVQLKPPAPIDTASPGQVQQVEQAMPDTAKAYGINPMNPQSQAMGAARMTSDLAQPLPSPLGAYSAPQTPQAMPQPGDALKAFAGQMVDNLNSGAAGIRDVVNGNYTATDNTQTNSLADKLFSGVPNSEVPTEITPLMKLAGSQFMKGKFKAADVAKSALEQISGNAATKVGNAMLSLNPMANAAMTGLGNLAEKVNPVISSVTGADPATVNFSEQALLPFALMKGAKLAEDTTPINNGGSPPPPPAAPPPPPAVGLRVLDPLKTTDKGQPLLVASKAYNQAPKAMAEFLGNDFDANGKMGISPMKVAQDLKETQASGLPVTALDVITKDGGGANIAALTKSIANTPGQGASLIRQMSMRGKEARDQIANDFDKSISSAPYYQTEAMLKQQMKDSGTAYKKAYANTTPIDSPLIQAHLQKPVVKAALKKANYLASNETGAKIMSNGKLTTQGVDYLKRSLDDMIEPLKRTGENNQARILTRIKNDIVSEADRINPDFAAARTAYGDPASAKDALEKGRNSLGNGKNGMDAEEIKQFFDDKTVTPLEKMSFASGQRRALKDMMGKDKNPIEQVWQPNVAEKLRPAFPSEQAFNDFASRMEMHKHMNKMNQIGGGSPTKANDAFDSEVSGLALGIKAAKGIANPAGAAMDIGLGLLDKSLQQSAKKMTKDTKTVIARYLTSKDPKVWENLSKRLGEKP